MKRTRWFGSWLVWSLLACGPVRLGNGFIDGGPAGGGDDWEGSGGSTPIVQNPAAGGGPVVGPDGASLVPAQTAGAGGAPGAGQGGAHAGGSWNVPVPSPPVERSKIDLLFMVDNSSSMADKQQILANVVPSLLQTLSRPGCVDSATGKRMGVQNSNGECPPGSRLASMPATDVHVGLISSSLGSHGNTQICDDNSASAPADSHNNDNGRLLTRGSMPSAGFLTWTAGEDTAAVTQTLANAVATAGQHGCGYEAQLESVYRFLVDPEPPASVEIARDNGVDVIKKRGVDAVILQQRAAFLRPDSLVVVVLVSDEDDCSLNEDSPQAWLALAPPQSDGRALLASGTSACLTNPNDPCCVNCAQAAPAGCPAVETDPACVDASGRPTSRTAAQDPSNLRCWRQKQRYGIDFLYSVQRYIDGFSQPKIRTSSGELVTNPLFKDPACVGAACPVVRDSGSVLVTAVVGVPWQDIAEDASDISKGFASASNLERLWPRVLGDPQASPPVPPGDPLMIDSVAPRNATTTTNPLGALALPNPNFDAPATANPINGHEWDTSKIFPQPNSDLQYACVFDLPQPRSCEGMNSDCDCIDSQQKLNGTSPSDYKNPLCEDATGAYSTLQRRAKAYPGLRELQVIKGLGANGVATSICPAVTAGDSTSPAYGYNPVISTIVDRVLLHLPKL